MLTLENKKALVIGLEPSGIAAARLLRERGAEVLLIDSRITLDLERTAETIDLPRVPIKVGVKTLPPQKFDFAVVAPEILLRDPLLLELKGKGIPVISELELGYQQSLCLNIA